MNILRRALGFGRDRTAGAPAAAPAGTERDGGFESWREAWRMGTEQARRRTAELRVDLSYGASENERFDLYLPVHRPRKLPFVAFVHGGDWRHRLRPESGFPARAVHREGAALVVIGLDAAPAVGLGGQAEQVLRAWRHLVDHAAHYGLDPARGHLLGHGSGATLAAIAASDRDAPAPASAVLVSGVYDLDQVRRSGCHGHLALDASAIARLSPIRRLCAGKPALGVAWGAHEPEASRRQSQNFAHACRSRGLRVASVELPGRDAMGTSLELANPGSDLYATLRPRG